MKRLILLSLLLAAVFAQGMLVTGQQDTMDIEPVAVQTRTQTQLHVSGQSVKQNGMTIAVQNQMQVREHNGSLFLETNGINKTITWTPEGVQMQLQTRGVEMVKTMNLSMQGERVVYMVRSEKHIETGSEDLVVETDSTVDAETGEVTEETEVIVPVQNRIQVRAENVGVVIDAALNRMRVQETAVRGMPEVVADVGQNQFTVRAENGEASMAQNAVQVRTREQVEFHADGVRVGGKALEVLPEQVQTRLGERAQLREMVLETVENKLQYRANITEQKKLFGIFGATVDSEAIVDAETGETQVRGPWWAFLAF